MRIELIFKFNVAFFFIPLLVLTTAIVVKADDRPYLEAARAAAESLKTTAIDTEHGKCWPYMVNTQEPPTSNLYDGAAGIALFFVEAYYMTGNAEYLSLARDGADQVLASVETETEMGLYLGIAGFGYALEGVYKASGEQKYRNGALQCLELIKSKAIKVKKGVTWGYCTDLFYGNAGIGLFLLHMAEEFDDRAAADLAAEAGQYLIDVALPAGGGLRWRVVEGSDRFYSNFAHGVSGIAYFLARLYEETGQERFLNGAIGGANYLISIAKIDGDACYFYVRTPGKEDTYSLSWCNGTTGTARLFLQLYKVTSEKKWMMWVRRCGNSVLQIASADVMVGPWGLYQCCGTAGPAQFLLSLYWYTGNTAYLDYCRYLVSYIQDNAIDQNGGFNQTAVRYTGFMTGTAGIGALFLRMDAFDRKKNWNIIFPDSPWLLVNRYDYSLKKIKTSKKVYSVDEKISISAKVNNIGWKKTPATTVRFYISRKADTVLGLPEKVTELGTAKLKRLGVGKKSKIKVSAAIPKGSKGSFYVLALVDPEGRNPDMFGINNHLASKSKITIKK